MAFNVWFRIWPAQQKIIRAVKDGQAPDAALVALAGARSRHNTYMSVPLVWGMINQHTVTAGTQPRHPRALTRFVLYLLVILVGLARGLAAVQEGREGQGILAPTRDSLRRCPEPARAGLR